MKIRFNHFIILTGMLFITHAQVMADPGTWKSNTAVGLEALRSNTTGTQNSAVGSDSLEWNTSGSSNTAIGSRALGSNKTGQHNTAVGTSALPNNIIGNENSALGYGALAKNNKGNKNTAIGHYAGTENKWGSGNVFLGYEAGYNATRSNKLYISNNRKTPLIYGAFSTNPRNNKLGIGTTNVSRSHAISVWNGAHLTVGGRWADASSRTLKKNIRSLKLNEAEAALDGLEPVRYNYINSPDEEHVGFIAEDVPNLVAMTGRKSLSPMDIVAVLTSVVKQQTQQIKMLQMKTKEFSTLKKENVLLGARQAALESRIEMLTRAMTTNHISIAKNNFSVE